MTSILRKTVESPLLDLAEMPRHLGEPDSWEMNETVRNLTLPCKRRRRFDVIGLPEVRNPLTTYTLELPRWIQLGPEPALEHQCRTRYRRVQGQCHIWPHPSVLIPSAKRCSPLSCSETLGIDDLVPDCVWQLHHSNEPNVYMTFSNTPSYVQSSEPLNSLPSASTSIDTRL